MKEKWRMRTEKCGKRRERANERRGKVKTDETERGEVDDEKRGRKINDTRG